MSKARQLADLGGDTANLEDISSVLSSGQLGNRNLIINGAMQVAQRGTSASTSSSGFYTVDRFYIEANGTTPTVTMSQDTASTPDVFTNALKLEVTSTGTPTGFNLAQKIEGYVFSSAGFGGSSAKDLTLSFWVRSSITGTYSIAMLNSSANRSYVAEYTINSANTWEQKTITITGDTSGTWLTTNGAGLQAFFCLDNDGGSFSTSTIGSWLSSNKYAGSANQVNWAGTNGATFYLTGVQLEVGDTATPFEHRSYGQELALCQRYFTSLEKGATGPFSHIPTGIMGVYNDTTQGLVRYFFPTEMRAAPSMSYSALSDFDIEPFDVAPSAVSSGGGTSKALALEVTDPSARTRGFAFMLTVDQDAGYIRFDAEL
jgi:hypothetical protein